MMLLTLDLCHVVSAQSASGFHHVTFFQSSINGPKQRSVTDVIGNPVLLDSDTAFRYGLMGLIPYGLKDMLSFSALVQFSRKFGSGGVVMHTSGTNAYQNKFCMLWISKKISQDMAIGARLTFHHLSLNRQQKYRRISGSVGFKLRIADNIQYALMIEDLNGWINAEVTSELGVLKSGLAVKLADNCFINIDVRKEKKGGPFLVSEINYLRPDQFSIGIGYDGGRKSAGFSFAFRTGKITIAVGMNYHSSLGYSAQTLLSNDLNVRK